MQDASQTVSESENISKPGKGRTRKPDEGNLIWKLYSELGRTRLAEFKALLKKAGIKFHTFVSHTGRNKTLSTIQPEHLNTYRGFFLESGVDLANELVNEVKAAVPAPLTASQQFTANEQQG